MKKSFLLCLVLTLATAACAFSKEFRIVETKQGAVVAGSAMVRLRAGTSGGAAALSANGFRIVEPVLSSDQALAAKRTMPPTVLPAKREEISVLEEKLMRTFVVEYESDELPEQFCKRIATDFPEVEYAEPWYVADIQYRPNDNLVDFQSMLAKCKFFEAWDIYKGSPSIVIGISDNGTDQSHEDLAPNISINTADPVNGIDDDGNGYIDDYNGYNFGNEVDKQGYNNTFVNNDHGTMTAGIAAAKTDNTKGIAGTGCYSSFFPMKTSVAEYPKRIVYGYKSLLYSAMRHFKVVNCSWGFPLKYSLFNQEIINYVAANDVAIVVAGGNVKYDVLQTNYPAGYANVLSVGEVNQDDVLTENTTLGAHVNIMAPGIGDYYPTFNDDYQQESIGGTSVATPVVTGLVALVRGKYPTLTAVQSLELVRQTADDISSLNPAYADILPGRVNALRALTTDPNSIPGLRPQSMRFFDKFGNQIVRYDAGDTVRLRIAMKNHLAAANNLRFVLSFAEDSKMSLTPVDSVVKISKVNAQSEFDLGDFSFVLNNRSSSKVFIRVDITGENGYKDFFLMTIFPYNEMRTLSNNSITVSFGDRGNLGYSPDQSEYVGEGFAYKRIGTTMEKGGLFLTADLTQASSSLFGNTTEYNDFTIIKPFLDPHPNAAIFTDGRAAEESAVGAEVTQNISIASVDSGYVKIVSSVKNKAGKSRNLLAAAYYVDFDMANVDSNRTSLFPEAIPESFVGYPVSAELVESSDAAWPIVGIAAFADNKYPARAFTAGLARQSEYSTEQLCDIVANGSSTQSDAWRDVAIAAGVEFSGAIEADSQRTCAVCFAAAANRTELAKLLRDCILSGSYVSAREENNKLFDFAVYPQPAVAHSSLVVTGAECSSGRLEIIDILGNSVLVKNDLVLNGEYSNLALDLSSFAPGVYIVKLTSGNHSGVKKIVFN